jgi:probable HAF family extracellular repeat protein
MKDIGTLGGHSSFGRGISNGRAVGSSTIANDAATHAFVIDAKTNTLTDLGTLPGGRGSSAMAINRKGTVAGNSDSSGAGFHAVIWINKVIQDIGSLGGSYTQATAINDSGMLAGWGYTAGNFEIHAWVGNLQDIGTLGGTFSQANGINNNGVVVGFSYTTGDADSHAFVWTSTHGMVDLNSLLAPGSPWDLQSADSISDDGVIVGVGRINGQAHAFSLTLPTT